jgi:hypothetical protein
MAVRDYSKGKIYKIVADTNEEYKPYVGSTIESLSRRMGGHRRTYKHWKNKGGGYMTSYDLFDKFGVDKCKIILLEEYSCENISQLLMKEREWFDKMECCNQIRPYRSVEEKFEQKKEQYQKAFELNPEHNKEKYQKALELNPNLNQEQYQRKIELNPYHSKEQYQKALELNPNLNKEQYQRKIELNPEHNKEKYQKNKVQIQLKNKETFTCNCGSILRFCAKARHERSLKHQEYLSLI